MRTVAAVGLVAALAACGLGETQRAADRVMAAADRTGAAPVLTATVRAELRATKAPGPSGPAERGTPGPDAAAALPTLDQPAPATLELVVVPGARQAALRAGDRDVAVFASDRVFLRRPDATADDARPWLELHLDDVRSGSTRFDPADFKVGAAYALAAVLDPQLLLDIAASPLSGSVRRLAADRVDSRDLEHYRANFDIDKALDARRRRHYTDDGRERVRRVLDLLSIDRTVNPGEVWLDDSGLRRVRLDLRVRPSQYAVSTLTVTIDMRGSEGRCVPPCGAAPAETITEPDRRETVVVESLSALQRAAAGLVGAPRA